MTGLKELVQLEKIRGKTVNTGMVKEKENIMAYF